ncbi:lactose regulatory protein lac9 and GAL4-like protein [Mortierella alpina]|nr:lactose regulatory protein lac9 and GAL4-like protein [Mortierella alpina]
MAPRHTSNGSIDSQACTFLDYPADASKAVTVVDHSSSEDLDTLTAMLAETTLNNVAYFGPSAAMVASTFNDDDLWGPQLGAASTEGDILVPEEMQILPDLATREQLAALYYKNHYFSLPMVQREVLRVCQENIHIPHCLLLCNAVYYCGSMFSVNTLALRKDMNDESTVGEDFFMRGQALLEKKYLTTHLCTVQALLLFAIGHKSPAQRSAFISQAITMALDMGLHTRLDDTVNQFMRSYRSRVFWCCYLFDSTASAISGKPTLINDEEITVDMFEAGDLGPETETFSDQYIIHCLHGWQICRKIRKNSKLIVRRPPPPQAVLLQNLARLDNELVEWQENLPKVFDFLPVEGAIVSDVSTLAACAQLLCYALIILLHHPYLPNPKSPEAFQPPQPGANLPDSQGYCTQAAKEITKIAGILLKEAPRSFEQNTPSRCPQLCDPYSPPQLEMYQSRRDLQKSMDYIERVENLQFFRINRAKKSDVADLLASCRAALSQQKSSLDLAKEAAALRHQQMLQEKKEKQRQLMEQQKQLQQQQQQQQQQTQQQSQQQEFSQHPVLASQAGLSQQNQQQQQQQQQHQSYKQQLQLQMYTQERDQQELARFNQLQRQGQLDMDHQRHQHFQQLAMAKHKQQIFMQQQQLQQTHGYRQQQPHQYQQHQQQLSQPHPLTQSVQHQHQQQQHQHQQQFHASIQHSQDSLQQYHQGNLQPVQPVSAHQLQNSTLFQGQPQAADFTQSMGMTSADLASTPMAMLDFHDPAVFASLPQEQQQQLFLAFSQSLNSGSNNAYYSTNAPFPQGTVEMDGAAVGVIQGQDNPMADFSNMMFDEQQRQMFSSAASASIQNQGGTVTFQTTSSTMEPSNGLIEDVFLSTNAGPATSIQARSMRSRSNTDSHFGAGSIPSPSPSVQSQAQLHHQRTASQGLTQPSQQQQQHGPSLGNNSADSQHQRSSSSNNSNSNNHGSPESMPSPGGSISEESILQSWSISTLHDNIYLNPNLSRDDPRNDLGTFMYLPSEFEYGDAPALSPAASSVNGGGSVNGQGNGSTGSDGGLSPRMLS